MGDYGNAMMRNQDAGVQSRVKAQSRANLLQLKLVSLHRAEPSDGADDEPAEAVRATAPARAQAAAREAQVAGFVSRFAEPGDPEYAPPVPTCETRAEKKDRIRQLKLEEGAAKVAEAMSLEIHTKHSLLHDLGYETSEQKVKRDFEAYGPIKRVSVHGKSQYR
ncbi:unnamed protein product [Triticum turgidum subsp. durum]|uniref:Uncharacterized protein n=1 Tax=Triticum turgidum subsp. durum TaxID=4567 RepID=A0A9R0V6C5_TRITD|nr:unnamed protein product [Triticum turgidum subsp. durum]